MIDLIRFVCRGALGSLIVPVLFFAYLYLVQGVYGGYITLLVIVFPFYTMPPGIIVGALLLCLGRRSIQVLKPTLRILIGAATVMQLLVVVHFFFFLYSYSRDNSGTILADSLPSVMLFIPSALIGGFAGLACPTRILVTRERKEV